jgi:hypothetical protein
LWRRRSVHAARLIRGSGTGVCLLLDNATLYTFAVLGDHAYRRNGRAGTAEVWEYVGFGVVLLVLLAISVVNLAETRFWQTDARVHAPWCKPGEEPRFQFGFADMASAIGTEVVGSPIECEHGEDSSSNTLQATTTGVAVYYWCTNTPTFNRGQDHWMLTPTGVERWTGSDALPRPLPNVHAPDLRQLCPT